MATKSDKESEGSEVYLSGEQHQALQADKTHDARRVTLPVPSLAGILTMLALCVLSFLGGMTYQKHRAVSIVTPAATTQGTSGSGNFSGGHGAFGGSRRAGGFGQVTAVSGSNITITNQRTNVSSTYSITSSTTITDNGQTVSVSDIQSGDTVIIMTSSSGSTTATRILVNPSFGGGRFGGTSAPADPGSNTVQSN